MMMMVMMMMAVVVVVVVEAVAVAMAIMKILTVWVNIYMKFKLKGRLGDDILSLSFIVKGM